MERLISVIVPVYKVEPYLDCCVESIVKQTYKNLEIILVDDGSPDQCPAMCDAWAEKDRRIKVIHKSNGGLSDARNAGLDLSSGDIIAFVDSDDWIHHEMFEKMLDALEKEGADICACNIISSYPQREVVWGGKAYKVGDPEKMLDLLYSDAAFPVCSWNKLYRRYLWEVFRFPVNKICEDAFTTYLLLDRSKKIVQITDALYYYRIRSDSIMTSAFSSKSMDEEEAWRVNYEYVREHYPRLARKAYTFYLQSVKILLQRISSEQQEQYEKEYCILRNILVKNKAFILFRSTASMKYRFRYLLDVLKL